MSLTLYYAPWSSASTCLWAIEELGVPCERIKLDLGAKETHTPEFLAKNPNGKVPVLVHDGVPLFESIAILAHLGETFGVERALFPAPGIERGQALQWLAWINVTFAAAVSRYMQNSSESVSPELRNARVAELGKTETRALMALLDDHLKGREWTVGNTFTLVDVHLSGALSWVGHMGFDTKHLPNLDAFAARCRARPAFGRVMTP